MPDYAFGGPADIDRAIGFLVKLDESQRNALAVLEIDDAIDELQREFEKMTSLERDFTSFVTDVMRRQGHTEAEIARDSYTILAIMGAFFHQSFRAWGEDLGGEPLAVHFDRAVENTTRILRDRETA